jgi:hypothetical protein
MFAGARRSSRRKSRDLPQTALAPRCVCEVDTCLQKCTRVSAKCSDEVGEGKLREEHMKENRGGSRPTLGAEALAGPEHTRQG